MLRSVCLAHLTSMVKHLPNDIKFNLPGEFLLGYRIKASLQSKKGGIAFGFDAAVEDAIISKETDCTSDG